jgi:hypothetical protein
MTSLFRPSITQSSGFLAMVRYGINLISPLDVTTSTNHHYCYYHYYHYNHYWYWYDFYYFYCC